MLHPTIQLSEYAEAGMDQYRHIYLYDVGVTVEALKIQELICSCLLMSLDKVIS